MADGPGGADVPAVPCVELARRLSLNDVKVGSGFASIVFDIAQPFQEAAVTVDLLPACDLAGATEVSSEQPEARRYIRIDRSASPTRVTRIYTFEGGCTERFVWTSTPAARQEASSTFGFVTRSQRPRPQPALGRPPAAGPAIGGAHGQLRGHRPHPRGELGQVEQAFRGLTDADWATPTKLRPLDESQPHWTLFELAGHFDISIGLTVMLMAEPQDGQVGRDRVSFFIFPRSEVAPVVYDYAYTMVEGKTPAQMPDVLGAPSPRPSRGAVDGPGHGRSRLLRAHAAGRVRGQPGGGGGGARPRPHRRPRARAHGHPERGWP